MNIKITYNWLLEYLETKATPQEMQKYLSLCGPSIERTEKIDGDFVFDIEVTSNRVDMASVYGVAQEAQAILPQFKIPAKLKNHPLDDYKLNSLRSDDSLPLNVTITDPSLCTRFTAVILKNVKIGESPEILKKRLTMCDVKSINNVIDISNYLMLSLGQPTHVFDYDKIMGHKMIMRLSKKDENITTLDKKEVTLPGGDIVIEDASGKLIDLCGIMGGLNSSVTKDTKNVLLFIQTYDKKRIRRTSMTTGIRTVAATYFEKGLNEEQVGPVAAYGVELFQKYAGQPAIGGIVDIYPAPYVSKTVDISFADLSRLMGLELEKNLIQTILTNLGFKITNVGETLKVGIPPSRKDDMEIKEDVVEEVARIYGYFNLPNNLQPKVYLNQPKDIEDLFETQKKLKLFLKHLGLHEVMNYSMISEEMIINNGLKIADHLKLKNTISEEIQYMRTHLTPSLLKNLKDNEGKRDILQFFEIAKTYKIRNGDLPEEKYKVGIIVNTSYLHLKGFVDSLLQELNIKNYEITRNENDFLQEGSRGLVKAGDKKLGEFGEVRRLYMEKNGLKKKAYLAVFDLSNLITFTNTIPHYQPINPFAEIKFDLTVEQKSIPSFQAYKQKALALSKYLTKVEFLGTFKDKMSLRFYFQAKDRNLTEDEASADFKLIKLG